MRLSSVCLEYLPRTHLKSGKRRFTKGREDSDFSAQLTCAPLLWRFILVVRQIHFASSQFRLFVCFCDNWRFYEKKSKQNQSVTKKTTSILDKQDKDRQEGRQTNWWTDQQKDRKTGRQTGRLTNSGKKYEKRMTERKKERKKER